MNTYIALLRGINVGGHNLLPMKELAALLEEQGLNQVRTYIQSGNVVFKNDPKNSTDLADRIKAAIEERHGFAPQVIVLDLAELERAVTSNPFPEAVDSPKTLHLFFLDSAPENPDLDGLHAIKRESERYVLVNKVFYLHAPEGIARSKVAQKAEKVLGVTVTARNWRTVDKLLDMAGE